MTAAEVQGVLRQGVASMRLIGIVYASGILRLTSERLEWQPFPFFQWFWHLSRLLIRTPVPQPLSIELSGGATLERGERLAIGAGPPFKRPIVVTADGQTHRFYVGVSFFDEADDWFNDLRAILDTTK